MSGTLKRLFCVLAAALLLTGCSQSVSDPGPVTYSVVVESEQGEPISDLKVFVYEDSTGSELVCVATTDEKGSLSFVETESDSFVAVVEDVPVGYSAQESYPVQPGQTLITLASRELTAEELSEIKVGLGDRMPDFTVTDCDGVQYELAQLLETKKAVLLNFWFLNCDPCKMEFPYLQSAYEQFKDQAAFLALNPVDGTDETIRNFRTKQALTFPMAVCDPAYSNLLNLTAYPTTVLLDRYGNICLIHVGMLTDASPLENALAYVCRDQYTPEYFETIEDIPGV